MLITGGNMNKVKSQYYEYDWAPKNNFQARVTLGEGNTALLPAGTYLKQWSGFKQLWIKHEEWNPTGCFKDRESAVVVSKALELGYKTVVVASSGNAALSTAAYAQVAGLVCEVFIPRKTAKAKKQLIRLFGAKLHEIPGFYEDVYRYLVDHPVKNAWNVTSGQNWWRVEGNKKIATEIYEQLGCVPDLVVVPVGNGGCLAGIWKGFEELKQAFKIDKTPRMIAVQVEGAAPLKTAVELGKDWVNLEQIEDSVAEGIVAAESYCSPKAVKAIIQSGGEVVTVTDQEIVAALGLLVKKECLVTEPTSAAAFAGLKKIKPRQGLKVVVVNTGSGMKMLGEIMKLITNK